MRVFRRGVPAVLVILLSVLFLKGSSINVPTGTWQSTATMSSARANAIAVLVPDGRIVIAGGADSTGAPTASAEAFSADGTFSALKDMSTARSQHAAIYTMTGDLLVTGGVTSGGGITNTTEVFDSLTNTWHSLSATMVDARAGHTMTQLQNGNILIAGGENSSGPVAALEIYDITSGQFSFAGTLATARKGHAAAVLNDGRVLIIGGTKIQSDGTSATLASTEIYDPSTGQVTAGPSLATPRTNATATTLLDGRVLVVGGSDPEGANGAAPELASAEIYDPVSNTFTASASHLTTARTGHLAFLLPNNNNVLILGGTNSQPDSTGTSLVSSPLASAELYTPWTDSFATTAPMSTARDVATGSALNNTYGFGTDGMLLMVGGTNQNSAEVYGFATVKTDRNDYAVGDTVQINGTGWSPGESVQLVIHELDSSEADVVLTVVADQSGKITNSQFSPDAADVGMKFTLTAKGSSSTAQTIFTDATIQTDLAFTISPTSVLLGSHGPVTFTATLTLHGSGTPLANEPITFSKGSTDIVTVNTNASGVAQYSTYDPSSLTTSTTFKANFPQTPINSSDKYGQSNATATLTIITDTTPPVITPTVTGTLGNNGWYTSDVTVSWTVVDNESSISSSTGCTGTTTINTDTAGTTLTCTATSAGGTSSQSVTIKRDASAPTATLAVTSGTLGSNGWYTTNVTVSTSGTDSVSGPAICTPDQFQTTNTSGTVFNGSCTNQAGLSTNAAPLTIMVDKTVPTATLSVTAGTAGAHSWYTSDVTVHTSGTGGPSNVTCTADQFLTTETTGTIFNGSCTNGAGVKTDASPLTVKLDKTGPSATLSAVGTLGNDNWYVSNVTVKTNGADNISSPVSCSGDQSLTTDTTGTDFNGSCTNDAGLTTNAASLNVKRDATPPANVTAAADRDPDHNGWYNHALTVTWTGTDSISGIASCTSTPYTGTDSATASLNGSCTDKAGNTSGSVPFTFKYDATGPSANLSVSAGTPGANNWYVTDVTVHASGSDSVSGIESCTPDQFQTAETTGTAFNGSCTNGAGLTTNATALTIKLDKTGPSAALTPIGTLGNNGWYVSNVTVQTTGSDSISSPVTCTSDQPLTTDTTGTTFNGSCTNDAGLKTDASSISVKRDATAPTSVTGAPNRPVDHNGWYNHPVDVAFAGTDSTSGIASCTTITYNGPDSASATINGTCTDNAGNTSASVPSSSFQYDATGPSAALSVTSGTSGTNGWYVTDVTVHTSGNDTTSGIESCTADKFQTAETTGAAFAGSCTNGAGLTTNAAPLTVKLDKTGPTATLNPVGTLGNHGWYVSDVTVKTSGTDSISSPVVCTTDQLLTTDTSGTAFNGSCTNDAGLKTDAASITVKRDATPPSNVTAAADRSTDHNGWYNHSVTITWSGADSTSGIDTCTSVPYNGPDSATASQNGTCTDNAGNISAAVPFAFKYDGTGPSAGLAITAGMPGSNGWYVSDVTVSTSGSDSVSSPVNCTADQFQTLETVGTVFNGSCTNDAGLTTSAAPLTVKVDKTGPTATLTPIGTLGNNGWYVSNVTIQARGTDTISSPVMCTADQSLTIDTTGTAFNGSCTNNAGLTTNASAITVKLDKTKPTLNIAINSPAVLQNGTYVTILNGSYTASPNATDSTSGLASQSCGSVTTASIGSQSLTCTATDNAGNQQTGSLTYAVQYQSGGFCLGDLNHTILQPVNADGSSVFKNNSTVPLKFRVCDAKGASIGTPGVVTGFYLTGQTYGTSGVDESVATNNPDQAFRWDPTAQQWIFNLSTKNGVNLANTTNYFSIVLNDGTYIPVKFGLR